MPDAPTAPPVPAVSAPKVDVPPPPSGELDKSFAAFDALMESPPEAPPPPSDKPPVAEKAPPPKPAETPPPDKPAKASGEKLPAPELRKAYEELKKKHSDLQAEHHALQHKPPAEDPEKKTLTERLTKLEADLAEREARLQQARYERSDEFQTKYGKPIQKAWEEGILEIQKLSVPNLAWNNETRSYEDTGARRQATDQDFAELCQMPLAKARPWANTLFGEYAPDVMRLRERVLEARQSASDALDTHAKEYGAREAQAAQKAKADQAAMGQRWIAMNEAAAKKYPQWFAPEEGDAKGNELLQKGMEFADSIFSGTNGKSPDEVVAMHSAARNQIAAFPRMVYRNQQQAKRIKELETKLKEYEDSVPGPGEGGGKPSSPKSLWQRADEDLERMAGSK